MGSGLFSGGGGKGGWGGGFDKTPYLGPMLKKE